MRLGEDMNARVELQIGDVWTNVSDRVFQDTITIQRGHPDESTTASPATLATTIDNHDGTFSSLNPLSPYYGELGLNTPIRVSVPDTSSALRLEADQASGASCPSTVSNRGLGSFEVWIDADADNWYTPQILAGQWTEAGNQRAWLLTTTQAGTLNFYVSTNGTSTSACGSFPLSQSHGRLSVRVTYNSTSGQVEFYTGQFCGSWVAQALSSVATGGAFASTAPVSVGTAGAASVTANGFNGKVYAFAVLQGLGGTVEANAVATADFTTLAEGVTSWTDAQSNAWSLTGTSEVSARLYLFHGECGAWPQSWTPGDPNARIALQAGGLLRRLGSTNASINSAMYRAYTNQLNKYVVGYWPFEDGPGSTQLASAIGGKPFSWWGGTPGIAGSSDFDCSAPIVTLANSGIDATIVPRYTPASVVGPGADAVVRFLLSVPAGGDTAGVLCRIQYTGGAVGQADLTYEGPGGALALTTWDGNGNQIQTTGPIAFGVDGSPLRMSVEMQKTGTNSYQISMVTLRPGASSGNVWQVTGTGKVGAISKITFSPDLLMSGTAVGHVSAETTWTSLFNLGSALNAFTGEAAGVRFARLCDEEGIQFRGIGDITDTTPMGAQTLETLANLIQECCDADRGMWIETAQVLGWGYRTRASLGNQASRLPLDYNKDQLADTLEPTVDDQTMKNDITVQNSDGSSSRQVLDDGTANSVSKVGRYDTSFTINLANDNQLDSEAGWILHSLTVNEPRYKAITVDLADSDLIDIYWDVLGVELGDRITVQNPPAWLPPGLVDQLTQGVTVTVGLKALKLSWNGIPSTPWNVAYMDDIVYGRFDTDGSTLAAGVSSTATSLSVATSTAGSPLWTTASADFPFDINIGGERITVTNITGASSPQTFTVTRSVNGVVKAQAANSDVRLWTPSIVSL